MLDWELGDRLDGSNGTVLRISDPARREGGKDRKDRLGAGAMDAEDLRRVMRSTGVDLWTLIEAAIDVAARDHGKELRARRDGIVERLYATRPRTVDRCGNCAPVAAGDGGAAGREAERGREGKGSMSPAARKLAETASPPSMNGEERQGQDYVRDDHRPIDEQIKILGIKEFLEDPDQSEDSLVSLLQNLADMEITFQALKETDIGRIVNGFRKHPSAEVRQLVKQLVRRWKDLVDEWVKSNSAGDTAYITDGDSPQQIPVKNNNQNGQQQTPEFGYSTNPHNDYTSSERNGGELMEAKAKPALALRKETPAKPNHSSPPPSAPSRDAKEDSLLDPERLASARRRLHENYQEAQNAKRQRTIQVMDLHEIPRPKNSFVRNKGGFQAKHW